eukprot:TRINITY_DN2803_c0_g1_i7.p1 TRINITY_DN2803_c0_g1~~TRINITY_DN2803_c0_g1_i7.p1  ORF type:complete len:176 (-),score=25.33 TRINITY_DN2803_c0_g1_i7:32-559(-)
MTRRLEFIRCYHARTTSNSNSSKQRKDKVGSKSSKRKLLDDNKLKSPQARIEELEWQLSKARKEYNLMKDLRDEAVHKNSALKSVIVSLRKQLEESGVKLQGAQLREREMGEELNRFKRDINLSLHLIKSKATAMDFTGQQKRSSSPGSSGKCAFGSPINTTFGMAVGGFPIWLV